MTLFKPNSKHRRKTSSSMSDKPNCPLFMDSISAESNSSIVPEYALIELDKDDGSGFHISSVAPIFRKRRTPVRFKLNPNVVIFLD